MNMQGSQIYAPKQVSFLDDSINQRDFSPEGRPSNISDRNYRVEEYKNYIAEVGNSFKQRKSRMELEREKQMNAQMEMSLADMI
jgi:hypothetical protein